MSDGALEVRFNEAMKEIYLVAKRDLNYNASYFLRMLSEMGGLAAARALINAPDVSDGFTRLWEEGRLDLSVEAHVLQDEFSPLFTDEERRVAKSRLEQYGWTA